MILSLYPAGTPWGLRVKSVSDESMKFMVDDDKPLTGYGAYGIIGPVDMHNKRAEFMAYLEEVKGLSYDSLSNGMLKEEFRGFMEDYNTATMPHVKFYSMERFEVSEAQRKKKDMKKLLHKHICLKRKIFNNS